MIKVLHIINGEFFAGAERVQDLLALRLPDQGVEVSFVCLKDGIFSKHRKSTASLTTISMRSRTDFGAPERIAGQVRAQGFHLVHTHTPRSAIVGRSVASKLRVPLIHHVHSPTLQNTESPLRNWANTVLEDRWVLPHARQLIAVSGSLRHYLLQHRVSDERITVVPNGVPVVRETPAWQPPVDGEWVIGTVALFRPRKGIEVLLQALRLLIDRGLRVRLKAVGPFETTEYEQAIKGLCHELRLDNHVEWVGFSKDVHGEMASMQVFVLPSLFGEGLPMVVIEAMSVGIPVVASRVEGIPEVIGTDDAGIVVEPNDPISLADGVTCLINGKVNAFTMATSAHRRQCEHYSDTAMTAAVAKVYRNVLDKA